MKTVQLEKAVGMVLPHDVTEIRLGAFKGPAFKKGHIIKEEDINHLKRLGKENIYVLDLSPEDIHENEAVIALAGALSGFGTTYSKEPVEGKINILAAHDGLLKINKDLLSNFNMLGEVMCATLHTDTLVRKGETVAGTRLIPLIGKREIIERAAAIVGENEVISVLPMRKARVGLVVTGNEIFHGRIQDAFEPVLRKKLKGFNSDISEVRHAPDDVQRIADDIRIVIDNGADLVITSGGMSVDPDDVTRTGIMNAGAKDIVYGTPVLPGAMFLAGYLGEVPILGLPACGMFHKITVLDLVLPRILAGERIRREEIAELGHGGLCRMCEKCCYPLCGFGK